MFSFKKQSTKIKERFRFTMLIYVPLFSSFFFFVPSKAFRSNHCCYSIRNRLLPSTCFYMTVSFIDFSPSTSGPLMCTPFFFSFWPTNYILFLTWVWNVFINSYGSFFFFLNNLFFKKHNQISNLILCNIRMRM